MGASIVKDVTYQGGARRGTTFKDGNKIRYVELHDRNEVVITDTEGARLWATTLLLDQQGYIVQEVSAETSSFGTPHIILTFYGFDANTSGTTRTIVLATDYVVSPPAF